ncbi:hypothetical protein N7478_009549 [Penicillium angulare]|uniref:uncharacterized protein n=1 Tax=Penicillium angulare TaxID=116970 RepID=UPI002540EFC6|nr:uncharacterized protein N7478_009549 [Penicillium angulare]KAJ5266741.1 hypothetical protein N7478_009549 [Penicillium angulare]
MDSEVPLPPPRRIRHRSPRGVASANTDPSTQTQPSTSTSVASSFRKTRRFSRFDDRSSQPSSDPALFSSDDIPASGLENYHAGVTTGGGRKRRYRGTWWGEQVVDPKRKRADFKEKRNVDSGVWMGSDESGAESLLPSEDSPWGEDLLKTVLDPKGVGKIGFGPGGIGIGSESGTSLSSASASVSATGSSVLPLPILKGLNELEEHRFARSVVNDCLEKGEDVVDLGNFNIRNIPSGLLQPLQHLTKLPSLREAPLTENAYTSLQPFLSIYLSGNSLIQLHRELFELNALKVLSVRNNKLHEIPSTIKKLTSLEVLNVSVNRLVSLPWELLSLLDKGDLKHLTARPNPFPYLDETCDVAKWYWALREREDKYDEYDSEPDCDLVPFFNAPRFTEYNDSSDPPPNAWTAIHVATSPTKRLDMEGKAVEEPLLPSIQSQRNTNAPSLREVALRAVCKLPDLDHLTEEELADFPALVIPLMQQVKKIRAAGGQSCSVCEKEYIIPRTEWLEWWDIIPHENGMKRPRSSGETLRPLPFKRFGCSWVCVPELELD